MWQLICVADNVAMRGERLELLVNKTENLSNNVSKRQFLVECRFVIVLEFLRQSLFIKPAETWPGL